MIKRERLTPRPSSKKNNKSISPQNVKLKQKIKYTQRTQQNSAKQNQSENSKQEHSLKVCLDLANYHRKQAQSLNVKNEVLQYKLKEQLQDMQNLKKQLLEIKNSLQNNHPSKKQSEGLKAQNCRVNSENQCLRKKVSTLEKKIQQLNSQNKGLQLRVEELTTQLNQIKQKKSQVQSRLLIEGQSKCDFDINILPLAKQSRRQQYAQNYQNYTFFPSAACLSCSKKQQQLEEARDKYCNQLRQLQEQVNSLQRSELAVGVMEKQMIAKNQCIDYLLRQLTIFQSDSKDILQNMALLQRRLQQVHIDHNSPIGYNTERLCHSFSKTVA